MKRQSYESNSNFETDTLKSREAWNDVFQALIENNCQSRLLYKANLSFITEEIKTLNNKQNLKQFMSTKAAQQKILKGILLHRRGR
jgi:hypothetical protein